MPVVLALAGATRAVDASPATTANALAIATKPRTVRGEAAIKLQVTAIGDLGKVDQKAGSRNTRETYSR
jgi:hypothetical protein